MGREIRRVPADWEHPKRADGTYHPCYDKDYETACKEWYDGAATYESEDGTPYHEYEGDPPQKEYYRDRKWTDEEATHYQMYEDVSEGTPVTPAFATKAELVDYLVEKGTYWNDGPWERKYAEQFVEREWAPSFMMIMNNDGTVSTHTPKDMDL